MATQMRADRAADGRKAKKLVRAVPATTVITIRNPGIKLVGLSEQESISVYEELKCFMLSKRFIYRHKWSLGDIVATDNLAGMHRATAFNEDTERRTIHRITIKGKAPLEAHYV